jgi:two-component system LytT family sensor kinase
VNGNEADMRLEFRPLAAMVPSAVRMSLPMAQERVPRPSLITSFLVWNAMGLFGLTQSMVIRASSGQPRLPLNAAFLLMESCWIWIVFTPVIWWLSERFPFDERRLRAALVHAAAALALLLLEASLNVYVLIPFLELPPRSLTGNAAGLFFVDMMAYAGIVAIEHSRRYFWRASRLQADLRQARLQALEAQLRPHFLFNALNTISSLVRAGQEQGAIRAVAALGDVLRGALRQTEAEVALRDELLLAERYLDLERARFGDSLSFTVDAEPETATVKVPSLLLQPLVENALKHGRDADGRAHIAIRAHRSGSDLRIEVRDTGSGPSPEAHDGIGLSNTRARLHHLYGDRGSLELLAAQGGGALAVVQLPFRPPAGHV